MKPYSIFIFWALFTIFGAFAPISGTCDSEVAKVLGITDGNLTPYGNPTSRSLLSTNTEQDDILLVLSDGTILSLDVDSGNILWSFSSGSPTSSFKPGVTANNGDKKSIFTMDRWQVPDWNDDTWIDLANDPVHGKDLIGMDAMKKLEKFVASGPHMSKDRFTLGSKRTTIFHLDAKSGSLINTYKIDDFPYMLRGSSKEESTILFEPDSKNLTQSSAFNQKTRRSIYIVRDDYGLRSFSLTSNDVLLDGMISNFKALYQCDNIKKPMRVIQSRLHEDYYALQSFGIIKGNPFCLDENGNNNGEQLPFDAFYPLSERSTRTDITSLMLYQSSQENKDQGQLSHENKDREQSALALYTTPEVQGAQTQLDHKHDIPETNTDYSLYDFLNHHSSNLQTIIGLNFLLLAFLIFSLGCLLPIMRYKSTRRLNDLREKKTSVSRRKKARKLGNYKNTANIEKLDKNVLGEEVENPNSFECFKRDGKETWSNLAVPIDGYVEGRKIGKLYVSNKEIAKGSNGTVILEGMYDGRHVAVKRLVQAHNDMASKEIQNLIASDRHPNIVRWYGVEYDSDFVYLSLELCTCSLNDLIFICSNSSQDFISTKGKSMNLVNGYAARLYSLKEIDKDVELWRSNGYPSSQLLKLMRDVVAGLAHLHELGIVHRDLKPQNILIIKERTLCAKVSDMGISKRLVGEKSSLGNHATGFGSSGWQAPEQLLHGRETRAVDLFSLGCILFFCITGGKHPFGDHLERDINIVKNQVDLFMVEHIPEAPHLFSYLLDPDPELRPKALEVLCHPLFWTSEMRLSFLRDASDRVELEDREKESEVLKALEKAAPIALGGHWNEKMEAAFITNIGRYRRYNFDSARDLLRVIRNKLNHYRELPQEIQDILGPVPEGFDNYFASRFPRFLIEVYKVANKYCRDENWFSKYCRSSFV